MAPCRRIRYGTTGADGQESVEGGDAEDRRADEERQCRRDGAGSCGDGGGRRGFPPPVSVSDCGVWSLCEVMIPLGGWRAFVGHLDE